MKKRPYFEEFWREFDREKSLVMISGPRQAGKTTLARAIAAKQASALYFNYDIPDDKVRLAEDPLFFQQLDRASDHRPLVILDEIHKYKSWKSYLKGIYDGFSHEYRFLATGSGKLDLYRRQGDALAARYRHFHLFPFTMGELYCEAPSGRPKHPGFDTPLERATSEQQEALDDLLNCSGFPEPFLRGTRTSYNRWASVYHREILRADVRDVSGVRDLDTVEMLYHLLIPRVGSPLSIAQLMGPLKTAHRTIGSWISLFDRLQLTFRLKPFSRRINRSILKEPKLYFIDYARVRNAGKRFENLIAVE